MGLCTGVVCVMRAALFADIVCGVLFWVLDAVGAT